jgi:hypothetical protein
MPKPSRDRIMFRNAIEFLDLPATVPAFEGIDA